MGIFRDIYGYTVYSECDEQQKGNISGIPVYTRCQRCIVCTVQQYIAVYSGTDRTYTGIFSVYVQYDEQYTWDVPVHIPVYIDRQIFGSGNRWLSITGYQLFQTNFRWPHGFRFLITDRGNQTAVSSVISVTATKQTYKYRQKQRNRQTDRQEACRHRQTGRQTERLTERCTEDSYAINVKAVTTVAEI